MKSYQFLLKSFIWNEKRHKAISCWLLSISLRGRNTKLHDALQHELISKLAQIYVDVFCRVWAPSCCLLWARRQVQLQHPHWLRKNNHGKRHAAASWSLVQETPNSGELGWSPLHWSCKQMGLWSDIRGRLLRSTSSSENGMLQAGTVKQHDFGHHLLVDK